VRMLGAFAGPERIVQLGEPDALVAQVSDGRAVDPQALHAALAGQPAAEQVLPPLGGLAELGDLDLWLTMSAAMLDRVTLVAAGSWFPLAQLLPAGLLVSDATEASRLGAAILLPGRDFERARSRPGAVVRGFGPGGPALAGYLAELARQWAELGRPETQQLQLTVRPAGRGRTSTAPPDGALLLQRPSVAIEVGWPAEHGQVQPGRSSPSWR